MNAAPSEALRPPAVLHAVRGPRGGRALGWLDLDGLGLPRLAGAGVDAWMTLPAGEGGFIFGAIDLPDDGGSLALQAERAYGEIFDRLARLGRPPLLRLWNYLPGINAEPGGLERYREFNIGRQRAFMAAGVDAFAEAPAACALGKPAGALSVRFLAGFTRVLPLENPRQVPAWRYSGRWGPKSPTFSRAVLADAGGGRVALLVSGTASIVGEDTLHPGDVLGQTAETLRNLQAMVDAALARTNARLALDELDLTVYLRHRAHLAPVQQALAAALPRAAAAALLVEADICRRELLVEIEAHGFAPGALA